MGYHDLTSYSACLFVLFVQILWFYWSREDIRTPRISSILAINLLTLLLLLPWFLFLLFNYPGKNITDPYDPRFLLSLKDIVYGLIHDWTPHLPLMIISATLLLLFPFVTKEKKKAWLLLSAFFLPILGLYLFCEIFKISHFISSRYFITFLPSFSLLFICLLRPSKKKLPLSRNFLAFSGSLSFIHRFERHHSSPLLSIRKAGPPRFG